MHRSETNDPTGSSLKIGIKKRRASIFKITAKMYTWLLKCNLFDTIYQHNQYKNTDATFRSEK